MLEDNLPDRSVNILAKLRLSLRPGVLLGEPVVFLVLQRQSAQSGDPDDWHTVGESIPVPLPLVEEIVFHLRDTARAAAAGSHSGPILTLRLA